MRNGLVILGVALLAITLLFSLINIAEDYALEMTTVGALLIGLGVAVWRTP